MARDFNENRNVNAILKGKKDINSPNVYYAVNDNADGYNFVEVKSLPTVEFILGKGTEQHKNTKSWTLFNSQNNYGGLKANAFDNLPNLREVTIWQEDTDSVLIIDDDAFTYNLDYNEVDVFNSIDEYVGYYVLYNEAYTLVTESNKNDLGIVADTTMAYVTLEAIYVHPDLLSTYQSEYSGKSFASLFTAYALVTDLIIPTEFNGQHPRETTGGYILDSSWIATVTQNMPEIKRNAKTSLIVSNDFVEIERGAFSGLGTRFINLQELKCNGTKTFASGWLNGGSWVKHLWLDNGTNVLNSPYCTDDTVIYANFRIVAPYLVFANYLMQEHNIKTGVVCPIVGYNQFSSGASLPQESPTGEYLWFSNINFDADYNSPTGLENDDSYVSSYVASSSGYYYCYDKTETLVIQDDGTHTLTSALVQSSINGLDTPLEWITKVIIPNTWTAIENLALDPIDNLINCDTVEINLTSCNYRFSNIYSRYNDSTSKIKNLYCGFTSGNDYLIYLTNILKKLVLTNATAIGGNITFCGFSSPSPTYDYYEGKELITLTIASLGIRYSNNSIVKMPKATTITGTLFADVGGGVSSGPNYLYLLSLTNITGVANPFWRGSSNINCKVYFGNTKVVSDTVLTYLNNLTFYVPTSKIEEYLKDGMWINANTNQFVGYLDYTDTVPTWTDYQATWYSDEDCTVQVLPANFVSGNRYYVKLTAI